MSAAAWDTRAGRGAALTTRDCCVSSHAHRQSWISVQGIRSVRGFFFNREVDFCYWSLTKLMKDSLDHVGFPRILDVPFSLIIPSVKNTRTKHCILVAFVSVLVSLGECSVLRAGSCPHDLTWVSSRADSPNGECSVLRAGSCPHDLTWVSSRADSPNGECSVLRAGSCPYDLTWVSWRGGARELTLLGECSVLRAGSCPHDLTWMSS